jgi:hypothetical protein
MSATLDHDVEQLHAARSELVAACHRRFGEKFSAMEGSLDNRRALARLACWIAEPAYRHAVERKDTARNGASLGDAIDAVWQWAECPTAENLLTVYQQEFYSSRGRYVGVNVGKAVIQIPIPGAVSSPTHLESVAVNVTDYLRNSHLLAAGNDNWLAVDRAGIRDAVERYRSAAAMIARGEAPSPPDDLATCAFSPTYLAPTPAPRSLAELIPMIRDHGPITAISRGLFGDVPIPESAILSGSARAIHLPPWLISALLVEGELRWKSRPVGDGRRMDIVLAGGSSRSRRGKN